MEEEYREDFIDFNIEIDTDSDLYKVVHQFSLEQSKKLQDRKDTVKRQADTLEKIIINLLRGYGTYRITLKKSKTDKSTRYQSTIYRSNYRKRALKFLDTIGFCSYTIGSWKNQRETSINPTNQLLSYFFQYGHESYNNKLEEIIIIKDADYFSSVTGVKFKVLYDDDNETKHLRNTLNTINSSIACLDVSYPEYINSNDNNHYQDHSCGYHSLLPLIGGQVYMTTKFRSLYRVFNDGSLDLGGRIFGGPWINMKKDHRKGMTINGESCCYVDYKSMAIMQLDARDGYTIYDEYDNYTIPGLAGVDRTAIKKHIQRMINSDRMPKSFNSKDKSISKSFKGVEFEYGNDAIMKHLSRISHYFGTGIGKRLMNEESMILITVLLKLIDLNIPALPLHDAVITPRKHSNKVKEIMEDVFDRFYQANGASAVIEEL